MRVGSLGFGCPVFFMNLAQICEILKKSMKRDLHSRLEMDPKKFKKVHFELAHACPSRWGINLKLRGRLSSVAGLYLEVISDTEAAGDLRPPAFGLGDLDNLSVRTSNLGKPPSQF